jgi:hypothetical protein
MHDFEITGRLKNEFWINPGNRIARSKQYVLVNEQWLYTEGARAARSYFEGLGLRRFVEDGNHCTHFAWRTACLLHDLHVRGGRMSNFALAVAEFHYARKAEPGDEHAIVVAVTLPFRPIFLEPQKLWINDGQHELNREEMASCFAYGL